MESGLIEVSKEVLSKPKVKGYMAIDEKGLCLHSEGINENLSGIFSSIANSAKLLDSQDEPVIELETDKGKILIQGKGNIVTTIYKTK
ncbi:ragulator complex protein LAMTOR5 homolog [Panonychus citri]|uniref:ragulator complex protein LAMTOR5 homolog n=1 Tax=Panonychus citri TaxID=50023 RepID=UPI00230727E2|nr:ragulator complex protein LAMTOR5 homolog [Panonychus citri]